MNKNTIEGSLKKFKGQIKEQWGKLTDDDILEAEGGIEKLAGKLQERYGYASDKAKAEVDNWSKKVNSQFKN